MISKIKRFDLLADLLMLSREEWLMLMGRMGGTVPRSRIVPDLAITPLTDFGRIRYARTGQRQWIVTPALELLDQTTQHAPPGLKSKDASSPTIIEAPDTPGGRLRVARERMDLNQTELGRKLGVSGSYISRIERDLVKIQPMVLRLAEALDVSVDYLLVLRDTPQRDVTGTALYQSTQDELVALRLLRMVIDELPPEDRVRLIHYLIKQAGIYKETFRARNPVPAE